VVDSKLTLLGIQQMISPLNFGVLCILTDLSTKPFSILYKIPVSSSGRNPNIHMGDSRVALSPASLSRFLCLSNHLSLSSRRNPRAKTPPIGALRIGHYLYPTFGGYKSGRSEREPLIRVPTVR